jgi:hypothetical protein
MSRNGTFIARLVAATAILVMQAGAVLAAPATQEGSISGGVTELQCDTDVSTGVTTFLVTVDTGAGNFQTVRIDQLTAEYLGLVSLDEDGNPDCSEESLLAVIGAEVDIDPKSVIPDEAKPQHPVGSALATFFSDFTDYDAIMGAHADGFGFGVIAQALWLTQKLEGDGVIFLSILEAKRSGDFSDFVLADGTTPKNWGQFRKAVMEKEQGNLGIVMSGKDDENGNGNGNGNGNDKEKDKDKGNKGNDKGKGKDK